MKLEIVKKTKRIFFDEIWINSIPIKSFDMKYNFFEMNEIIRGRNKEGG